MVFLSSLRSDEYKVVVLPEPVGPVTSTMPWGESMILRQTSSVSEWKPRLSSSTLMLLVSRIRMTVFSP